MYRNRRRWRRHRRPTGVIINAREVIVSRDDEDLPPNGRMPSFVDLVLGALGGMLLLRLIDLGRQVIVLQ